MTLATKAALFSAFVFPGSGYFILKQKLFAYLFILSNIVILFFLMSEATYKAQIIAQTIVDRGFIINISEIKEQIQTLPGKYDPLFINSISWMLGIMWLLSISHCYYLGKQQTLKPSN